MATTTNLTLKDEAPTDGASERTLWAAVLQNAFHDAQKPINKHNAGLYCVKAARSYLLKRNESLDRVCDSAGIEPDWIIRKAKEVAKLGWGVTKEEQAQADKEADLIFAAQLALRKAKAEKAKIRVLNKIVALEALIIKSEKQLKHQQKRFKILIAKEE